MKHKTGKIIASISTVIFAIFTIFITCFALIKSDGDMNSKQGLPDIKNGIIDFTGYDIQETYVKQHMKGEYEFFYN